MGPVTIDGEGKTDAQASPLATTQSGRVLPGVTLAAPIDSSAHEQRHLVQFYDDDASLYEVVTGFIAEGLSTGDAAIAIVTPAHQKALQEQLLLGGIDVQLAHADGRLSFVDAEQLLAQFMVGSMPDVASFTSVVTPLLDLARSSSPRGRVRAYGEMVNVLWSRGNSKAAIRLEELWSELQAAHSFSLLCAYVMANFYKHPADQRHVCSLHTHVVDCAHGSATLSTGQNGHAELSLSSAGTRVPAPRNINSLAAEIAQRREVECALRDSLCELRQAELLPTNDRHLSTTLDALPVLIAYVGADHCYRFVNAAYEQWFGRSKDDIVGRHVEEVLGNQAYQRLREHFAAALNGERRNYQTQVPYAHGGSRFIEATYIPHVRDDGAVEGFVAFVADISEQKILEHTREAGVRRTERLMKITAALADAVTAEQVFEAVVDQVAATVEASSAALFELRAASSTIHLVHATGYSEDKKRQLASVTVDATPSFPALDAIRSGRPLWFSSQQELLETYPHLRSLVTPERSYQVACLPLAAQGRIIGSVGFTFDASTPLDAGQKNFLLLVARYSGQALERLRLLEIERSNRALAEAAAARAHILSRASRAFAEAGQDVSTVLGAVVEQVTCEFAELCGVALVSGNDLKVVAIHHKDPEATRLIRALLDAAPLTLGESASGQVVATGQSVFMPTVDPEATIRARPEYRPWLERFMPRSVIIAPLRVRGKIIGTLGVIREQSSDAFTEIDLRFVEELGERAAMAIESSRLHGDSVEARQRTEILYDLARAVIEADKVEQVYASALDALEQALGTARSAILTFDADSVMRFKAWRGLSTQYRNAVEGHSPWPRDAKNPEPLLVSDALNDPGMVAYRELFNRERIGALGFIPLVAAGQLIGKFMVYYDGPHKFASQQVDMAEAIANHVAAAGARFAVVAELQQTVRFNEMFTGILGHDLRNPLGAIMTSAQLAVRRGEGERLMKPLRRILSSGERMARMIEQLLDFTRVRVGAGIPIEPDQLDLIPLLRHVIDELASSNPRCILRLERAGNTFGYWDLDRLAQVFSNLVANALYYGESEAGVLVRVDGTQPDHVNVEVHNAGAIPADIVPKLFEPMPGGEKRRQKSNGLGLGLYISQQIVKAHGGIIDVHSSETAGTTFTASLPRYGAVGEKLVQ